MNKPNYKAKISLIRNKVIIGSVIPNMEKGADKFSFNTSSGIFTFPTSKIISANTEFNKLFTTFSNQDMMRLEVSEDDFKTSFLLFEGEFYKKTMNIVNKDDSANMTLDIQGIHSFFRLSLLKLSSVQHFNNITFSEFIKVLTNLADIASPIDIEPTLGNTIVNGISNKTNAFRLFKEVCLTKKAIVAFNKDNSINIDFSSEILKAIKGKVPIQITNDQILSMNSNEQL